MEINGFQRNLDIHGLPWISIEINGFPVILESIGYPLTGVIINWFLWTNNDIHRFLSISTEIDKHLKNYPWISMDSSRRVHQFLVTSSIHCQSSSYIYIHIYIYIYMHMNARSRARSRARVRDRAHMPSFSFPFIKHKERLHFWFEIQLFFV